MHSLAGSHAPDMGALSLDGSMVEMPKSKQIISMLGTTWSFTLLNKMKSFFLDHPEWEELYIAGTRISYFIANYYISVLITYLTEAWQVDLFHAVVITIIQEGAKRVLAIFVACLAHAYLGNSGSLLLCAMSYFSGLLLLSNNYPHLTKSDITNCTENNHCVKKSLGLEFCMGLVLITVGQSGYINYEASEEEAIDNERKTGQQVFWFLLWLKTGQIGKMIYDSIIQIVRLELKKWLYFIIGGILGLFVLPIIPDESNKKFLIPAIILAGSSVIYLVGKLVFYPFDRRKESPLFPIFRVYEAALRKMCYDMEGTFNEYTGDEDMSDQEHEDHKQNYSMPQELNGTNDNVDDDNSQTSEPQSDNSTYYDTYDGNDDDDDDDDDDWNSNPLDNHSIRISIISVSFTEDNGNQMFRSRNYVSTSNVDNSHSLELQSGTGDHSPWKNNNVEDDDHNPDFESEKNNDGTDDCDLWNFELPPDVKTSGILNGDCTHDNGNQKFGSHNEDSTSDVENSQNLELQSGIGDQIDHNPWKDKTSIGNHDNFNLQNAEPRNGSIRADDHDHHNQNPELHSHLKDIFRCLNRAALYAQSEDPKIEVKKRRLCTVQQVKDAKHFTRAMCLSLTFVCYGIMKSICTTFFVLQASNMDTNIMSFIVPVQVIMWTPKLTRFTMRKLGEWILAKKVYESRCRFYGALRICIGILVSVPCFGIATLVERKRLNASDISAFLLIPQLFLVGVMDGLAIDGMKDFFIHEIPNALSISHGALLIEGVTGAGKILSIGLVALLRQVTKRHGQLGWFGDQIDHSRLDHFYTFMSVFGSISCIISALISIIDCCLQRRVQSESPTSGCC